MMPGRLRITSALALLLAVSVCAHMPTPAHADSPREAPRIPRVTISFDRDWRFLKGDAQGAERPEFDDATWRKLDVPHDWSIEGPFAEKNPTGKDGGYLPAGVGWYRKHFDVPAEHAGRRVFVEFDGVMANSDVWVNGHHLGRRPYGYIAFRYELTPHLNFGRQNVIAVRADNSGQPASRWYTGAGIYRHVRLVTTSPVHFEHWGTFVTTPQFTDAGATVRVRSTIVNQSNAARRGVLLRVSLAAPNGQVVATAETAPQTIEAGGTADFVQELSVKNPRRWDIKDPALYRALVYVRSGGMQLDDEVVTFGIREFKFEPATGFWLNGRNFKLKGVCLHHDGERVRRGRAFARVGAPPRSAPTFRRQRHPHRAQPARARVPRPRDRMGFIVMDETFDVWTVEEEASYDYHLLLRRVVEDRHARHRAPRPQPPVHRHLQHRQRDPRHAEARPRQAHPCRADRGLSRRRPDAPGDAGTLPSEREQGLRQRPRRHARRGRAELPREGDPGRLSAEADA